MTSTRSYWQEKLAGDVLEGLRKIAQVEQATDFMVVLAALKVVVMRYTGQSDIVIATSAGPGGAELLLRTDCSGSPTFRELVGRVRQTTRDAAVAEQMPVTEAPISFEMGDSSGGLETFSWRLSHRTDLFDESTVRRLSGHLGSVLTAVAYQPDLPIDAVELLTPAERDQLLTEWNATAAPFPRAATIAELFEAQVSRTPGATAVVHGDGRVTYRDLNARANRLARRLQTLGVGPEKVVGVCLPPGTGLVVGLLAILKAGGAYAPLDAAYPAARLSFLLADTRAVAVLADESTGAVLADAGVPLVHPETGGPDDGNLPALARPESLAYLIYTSGSTGTPKGVEVPHRGVVNLLWSLISADFPDYLLGTVLTFDIAALELFAPLVSGGTVVVSTGDYVEDVAARPERLTAQATPSKW
ncbi:MAG: AMP-binding protein, partial [Actinoplanes sp.]